MTLVIFDYVEDNLVKGWRRGKGRQSPMFAPHDWNCFTCTAENNPRTINTCEAWHRRITLIGKHHSSFYHVLQELWDGVAEIDKTR